MGKYINFEFKTHNFNSRILADALAKLGWYKNIQPVQRISNLHLLWLSRFSIANDNDPHFLEKVHIVNKIRNFDSLVQTSIFHENLNKFIKYLKTKGVTIKNFNLEWYTVPSELDEFHEALEKDLEEK